MLAVNPLAVRNRHIHHSIHKAWVSWHRMHNHYPFFCLLLKHHHMLRVSPYAGRTSVWILIIPGNVAEVGKEVYLR